MSKSLSNHLNGLLNDAVNLLSNYQDDLLQEWEKTYESLMITKKKSVAVFKFISDFFGNFLNSIHSHKVDIYQMLNDIHSAWDAKFDSPPEPEALIFHLNLLENSAHKVLKSRIAYSSKLHPSIHYLFSKISEGMIFQIEKESDSVWKDSVILFNEWVIRSQTFQESHSK